MTDEYESLIKKGTFEFADVPDERRPIGCKWVLTLKRDADGKVTQFKARLVAQGFSQRAGLDYNETFASVVKFASIRMLCALSAQYGLSLFHADVKTAYLNGDLEEQIFMTQPSLFDDGSGRCLELLKAIYGLKQAGRAWYKKLWSALEKLGFQRATGDNSLFVRQ
jgi:hypothetical protein